MLRLSVEYYKGSPVAVNIESDFEDDFPILDLMLEAVLPAMSQDLVLMPDGVDDDVYLVVTELEDETLNVGIRGQGDLEAGLNTMHLCIVNSLMLMDAGVMDANFKFIEENEVDYSKMN